MEMSGKKMTGILAAMGSLLCSSCATTGGDGGTVGLEMREAIEWCNIWHYGANRDDKPRVLLVGDSIVAAHAPHVAKLLDTTAHCSWLTTSRCLGDPVFGQ